MNKVIRDGVKTRFFMLSATPVNNRSRSAKPACARLRGAVGNTQQKLEGKDGVEEIFRRARRR